MGPGKTIHEEMYFQPQETEHARLESSAVSLNGGYEKKKKVFITRQCEIYR